MHPLLGYGLMFILPLLSIAAEATTASGADPVFLVGKWFVFWGGVRLSVAGLSQVLRPELISRGVFGVKDRKATKIVSELGYANVSIGLPCAITLAFPEWVLPGALLAGTVHALAAGRHGFNRSRRGDESLAMVGDCAMVLVLGLYVLLESI